MRDGSARQLRSGRARAGRLSLLTDGMGSATDSGSGCTARLLTPAMIAMALQGCEGRIHKKKEMSKKGQILVP